MRAAVRAWDLPIFCRRPEEYSNTLTAVVMPEGADSGRLIEFAGARLNLALGVGLGQLKGRVFRIGHLGALNELEVLATLAGCELALRAVGVPVVLGSGVAACQEHFARRLA